MKVALVHDYLREYGGAERVLEVLHEIWPTSPLYTAFIDRDNLGIHGKRFKDWKIRTSWGQKLPFIYKLFSPYRIFAPAFFASFDFSGFDVVISSSSVFFAKAIRFKPPTIHICYCHTPPRFLYGYPTAIEWQRHWWGKMSGSILNHYLRMVDWQAAQKVDYFIANSKETAKRIKKFYRRDSTVIYPPVELGKRVATKPYSRAQAKEEGSGEQSETGSYFLCVSRLARAKRIDLAIEACNQRRLPLKVVGTGREETALKAIAGPTVEFLGEVSDEKLVRLYTDCQALIFPAEEEDFGIVPVEAMSFGKPVIALRSGGVRESVIEGVTGEFFNEPTVESLLTVLKNFKAGGYKPENCINQAEEFSKERFEKEIKKFVQTKWKEDWKND